MWNQSGPTSHHIVFCLIISPAFIAVGVQSNYLCRWCMTGIENESWQNNGLLALHFSKATANTLWELNVVLFPDPLDKPIGQVLRGATFHWFMCLVFHLMDAGVEIFLRRLIEFWIVWKLKYVRTEDNDSGRVRMPSWRFFHIFIKEWEGTCEREDFWLIYV